MVERDLLAVHPDPTTREDCLEGRRVAASREQEKLLHGRGLEAVLSSACCFASGSEEA
jgi:hypothetical protein